MKLLEALIADMGAMQPKTSHLDALDIGARIVHFAFADNGDVAYLSALETETLVPLLEKFCADKRVEMGPVH